MTKTEEIYEIYDELYRGYNSFKNEIDQDRKETIMSDCHPSITLDDWAYQFYFNEDGDIFCLPNESEAYYVASFEEDKDIVVDILIDFLDN